MRRLKDEAGGRTLYVGDSITDLGALLTADIGIIMGCNATLRRIAAAAGITIAPLVTGAASSAHGSHDRTPCPVLRTCHLVGLW